jgi:hypothetical protein
MLTFAPTAKSLRFALSTAALGFVAAFFADAALAQTRPASPSTAHRPVTPAEIQRRQQQAKADFERKRAEHQRELDQHRLRSKPQLDRVRQQTQADVSKARAASAAKATPPPPPPFNPASAPPPGDCLKTFFAAARNAQSMDSLLTYLPLKEQQSLKEQQATYDPQEAAASRQRWKERRPDMSEHSLTFLTNSAYANALDHYRTLAMKFIDVLDVKVEGNKATVIVSTHSEATSGTARYPYSKATIELVGEAGFWRLSTYNDSNWSYQELPTAP